jgi:hypothetical protein
MYSEQFLPPGFKLSRLLSDMNSYQIDNPRLISDLISCCVEDPYLSTSSDNLKRCMGDEYEELLYELLKAYGLCFETEAELRLQGKPKTPDVLFLFPVGVKIGTDNDEWQIIHWIDSKGTVSCVSCVLLTRTQQCLEIRTLLIKTQNNSKGMSTGETSTSEVHFSLRKLDMEKD